MVVGLVDLGDDFSNTINSIYEYFVFCIGAFDEFFQFPDVNFLALAIKHVGEFVLLALSLHPCDNNNQSILNVI